MNDRDLLLAIINAANANPEPIHYAVRAAIQAAQAEISNRELDGELAAIDMAEEDARQARRNAAQAFCVPE